MPSGLALALFAVDALSQTPQARAIRKEPASRPSAHIFDTSPDGEYRCCSNRPVPCASYHSATLSAETVP
ncbi:hypothetical protein ACFWMG_23270 [Streptomyces sp. NPDC127074]|uniref:hypothetical protein n=1 Tax=Streptomyces sp. NPDC127074 TaxID=3347130 RepID=UPI003666AAC1